MWCCCVPLVCIDYACTAHTHRQVPGPAAALVMLLHLINEYALYLVTIKLVGITKTL